MANENYWDGAPEIKSITVKNIGSDTKVDAMLSGDIDLAQGPDATALNRVENNDDINIVSCETKALYAPSVVNTTFSPSTSMFAILDLLHESFINRSLDRILYDLWCQLGTIAEFYSLADMKTVSIFIVCRNYGMQRNRKRCYYICSRK